MKQTIENIITRNFNEEEQKKLFDEIEKNPLDMSFLTPREEKILELREEGKTLEQCGKELGVTRERIRQIERKGIMRFIRRLKSLLEEIKQKELQLQILKNAEEDLIIQLKQRIPFLELLIKYINELQALSLTEKMPTIYDEKLEYLDLSIRSYNCLMRYLCKQKEPGEDVTIGDVAKMSKDELLRVRNLGRKSLKEIKDKLAEYNIYLRERD